MDAALHTRRSAALRSALMAAACTSAGDVLAGLGSGRAGLSGSEAARRLAKYGPNAVRVRRTGRAWSVLGRQLRSPLLLLLVAAATASYFVGERADAVIIGAIVAVSVGLGVWQRVPGGEGGRGAAFPDPLRLRDLAGRRQDSRSTSPPGPRRRRRDAGSARWCRRTCACCTWTVWSATSRF